MQGRCNKTKGGERGNPSHLSGLFRLSRLFFLFGLLVYLDDLKIKSDGTLVGVVLFGPSEI